MPAVFPVRLVLLVELFPIVFDDDIFPFLEFDIFDDPEPFDIMLPFIDEFDIFDDPDEVMLPLPDIVLLPVIVLPPDIFVLLVIELEFMLLIFEFVFVEFVLVALEHPPAIKAEVRSAP